MNIQFIANISAVQAEHWNQVAGTDYPFLRHEFLLALEQSGVVTSENGWQPQHLLVFAEADLIAACPLYLKFHSQGEFVLDHQWADAFQRQGLAYYPKGLTAVPFTPCPAQRLLFKAGVDEQGITVLMVDALKQHLQDQGITTWHCSNT